MSGGAVRRVVVAPTAFKGTLSPSAVAGAIAEGVRRVWPAAHVVLRPLSDGGTGFLDAYEALFGGRREAVEVTGPVGAPTAATLLWDGDVAVLESAEACGIHKLPGHGLDPLSATTRGVGELLLAVRERAGSVILGLGGSASVDGGTGMARALGWEFSDSSGVPLPEGGGALVELDRITRPGVAWSVPVLALCDVENRLTGPAGAARTFGPQKGADPAAVERLEMGLARLAARLQEELRRRVDDKAGVGAAGGLGAGALAFLNAELVLGAEWMIERAGLLAQLARADLLVTGEGRFDAQSAMGKLTGRALAAARAAGVPALLVAAQVEGDLTVDAATADGGGRRLDRRELSDLAESGCRGLAHRHRL